MTTLYHGTSSRFVRDILEKGLGALSGEGKYAEIRTIMSKYVEPSVLTDEFFDKYSQFIASKSFSKVDIRESQAKDGNGPFGVFYDVCNETHYRAAPSYAKSTTSWGGGEFEYGVVEFLNTVSSQLDNASERKHNSPEYKEFLELIKNNAKPEFVDNDGKLKFSTAGNYQDDFPIMLKMEVPAEEVVRKIADDARIRGVVKPEWIKGIAFVPPFYVHNEIDRLTPELKFMEPKEFLEELGRREGKRHWLEPFEVKEVNLDAFLEIHKTGKLKDMNIEDVAKCFEKDTNTKVMISFPKEDIACIEEFRKGKHDKTSFYSRKEHINEGKIAEMYYEDGVLSKGVFFEGGKPVGAVIYDEGKAYVYTANKSPLTEKQKFMLEYKNMSDLEIKAHIQKRKEELKKRRREKTRLSGSVIASKIVALRTSGAEKRTITPQVGKEVSNSQISQIRERGGNT